jgi:hypothetical protein
MNSSFRKYVLLPSLIVLLSFSLAKAQETPDDLKIAVSLYTGGDLPDSTHIKLLNKIFMAGKAAIPVLIDQIDRDEKGSFGSSDVLSNYMGPQHLEYIGIRAAYLIERIQKRDNKHAFYRNFTVRKNGGAKLNYQDMKKIKELYQHWWDWNKFKSLDLLTIDWNGKKRALTGSKYYWQY